MPTFSTRTIRRTIALTLIALNLAETLLGPVAYLPEPLKPFQRLVHATNLLGKLKYIDPKSPVHACTWVETEYGSGCSDNKDLYRGKDTKVYVDKKTIGTNQDADNKTMDADFVPNSVKNSIDAAYKGGYSGTTNNDKNDQEEDANGTWCGGTKQGKTAKRDSDKCTYTCVGNDTWELKSCPKNKVSDFGPYAGLNKPPTKGKTACDVDANLAGCQAIKAAEAATKTADALAAGCGNAGVGGDAVRNTDTCTYTCTGKNTWALKSCPSGKKSDYPPTEGLTGPSTTSTNTVTSNVPTPLDVSAGQCSSGGNFWCAQTSSCLPSTSKMTCSQYNEYKNPPPATDWNNPNTAADVAHNCATGTHWVDDYGGKCLNADLANSYCKAPRVLVNGDCAIPQPRQGDTLTAEQTAAEELYASGGPLAVDCTGNPGATCAGGSKPLKCGEASTDEDGQGEKSVNCSVVCQANGRNKTVGCSQSLTQNSIANGGKVIVNFNAQCGDGKCGFGEDAKSCAYDCKEGTKAGDGTTATSTGNDAKIKLTGDLSGKYAFQQQVVDTFRRGTTGTSVGGRSVTLSSAVNLDALNKILKENNFKSVTAIEDLFALPESDQSQIFAQNGVFNAYQQYLQVIRDIQAATPIILTSSFNPSQGAAITLSGAKLLKEASLQFTEQQNFFDKVLANYYKGKSDIEIDKQLLRTAGSAAASQTILNTAISQYCRTTNHIAECQGSLSPTQTVAEATNERDLLLSKAAGTIAALQKMEGGCSGTVGCDYEAKALKNGALAKLGNDQLQEIIKREQQKLTFLEKEVLAFYTPQVTSDAKWRSEHPNASPAEIEAAAKEKLAAALRIGDTQQYLKSSLTYTENQLKSACAAGAKGPAAAACEQRKRAYVEEIAAIKTQIASANEVKRQYLIFQINENYAGQKGAELLSALKGVPAINPEKNMGTNTAIKETVKNAPLEEIELALKYAAAGYTAADIRTAETAIASEKARIAQEYATSSQAGKGCSTQYNFSAASVNACVKSTNALSIYQQNSQALQKLVGSSSSILDMLKNPQTQNSLDIILAYTHEQNRRTDPNLEDRQRTTLANPYVTTTLGRSIGVNTDPTGSNLSTLAQFATTYQNWQAANQAEKVKYASAIDQSLMQDRGWTFSNAEHQRLLPLLYQIDFTDPNWQHSSAYQEIRSNFSAQVSTAIIAQSQSGTVTKKVSDYLDTQTSNPEFFTGVTTDPITILKAAAAMGVINEETGAFTGKLAGYDLANLRSPIDQQFFQANVNTVGTLAQSQAQAAQNSINQHTLGPISTTLKSVPDIGTFLDNSATRIVQQTPVGGLLTLQGYILDSLTTTIQSRQNTATGIGDLVSATGQGINNWFTDQTWVISNNLVAATTFNPDTAYGYYTFNQKPLDPIESSLFKGTPLAATAIGQLLSGATLQSLGGTNTGSLYEGSSETTEYYIEQNALLCGSYTGTSQDACIKGASRAAQDTIANNRNSVYTNTAFLIGTTLLTMGAGAILSAGVKGGSTIAVATSRIANITPVAFLPSIQIGEVAIGVGTGIIQTATIKSHQENLAKAMEVVASENPTLGDIAFLSQDLSQQAVAQERTEQFANIIMDIGFSAAGDIFSGRAGLIARGISSPKVSGLISTSDALTISLGRETVQQLDGNLDSVITHALIDEGLPEIRLAGVSQESATSAIITKAEDGSFRMSINGGPQQTVELKNLVFDNITKTISYKSGEKTLTFHSLLADEGKLTQFATLKAKYDGRFNITEVGKAGDVTRPADVIDSILTGSPSNIAAAPEPQPKVAEKPAPVYEYKNLNEQDDLQSLIKKSDEAADKVVANLKAASKTLSGKSKPEAYRLTIPTDASEDLVTEIHGFNQFLTDFESTIGYHFEEDQIIAMVDPHYITKLEAGGGKTDAIIRALSAKDGRGFVLTSKEAEALDFINKQMLGDSSTGGRDFYKARNTEGYYLDNQHGPLKINLDDESFNPETATPATSAEFEAALARAQKGESGILIVGSRAPAGWTYMSGNHPAASWWNNLFGNGSVKTNSELFADIINGDFGKFTILADEIGDDITGSLAISAKAVPLRTLKDPKDLMGLSSGSEAVRLQQRVRNIAELTERRAQVLDALSSGKQQDFFTRLGSGQVAPKDPIEHASSLASLLDTVMEDPKLQVSLSREPTLRDAFDDLSKRLRAAQNEAELTPLLQELDTVLRTPGSNKQQTAILTELTFSKQNLQDRWAQLSRVPETDFAFEGADLVLRKTGGTTGERLSTVSQLLAFYNEGPEMLSRAGKEINKTALPSLENIGISRQQDQITIRQLYEKMLEAGHNLRTFDATPNTAAHTLGITASGESEVIAAKPTWLGTAKDQDGLITQFGSNKEAGKAQAVVLAGEKTDFDSTTIKLAEARGKDQKSNVEHIAIAQYTRKPDGETAIEYRSLKRNAEGSWVADQTFNTQAQWDAAIHKQLKKDPEALLVAYQGRVRAVDLSVDADSLKLQWSVFAEDTTDVEAITQAIKRNRLQVARQQVALRGQGFTSEQIAEANRYGLYIETARNDLNLTRDNAMQLFEANHQQNLAQIRLDTAIRSFAESRTKALEAIRANLDQLTGESSIFNFRRLQLESYLDSLDAEAERLKLTVNSELSRTPLTDPEAIALEIYERGQKADADLRKLFENVSQKAGLTPQKQVSLAESLGVDAPFPTKEEYLQAFHNPTATMTQRSGVGPGSETMLWAANNSTNARNPLFKAPTTAWINPTIETPKVAPEVTVPKAPVTALNTVSTPRQHILQNLATALRPINIFNSAADLVASLPQTLNDAILKPLGIDFNAYSAIMGVSRSTGIIANSFFFSTTFTTPTETHLANYFIRENIQLDHADMSALAHLADQLQLTQDQASLAIDYAITAKTANQEDLPEPMQELVAQPFTAVVTAYMYEIAQDQLNTPANTAEQATHESNRNAHLYAAILYGDLQTENMFTRWNGKHVVNLGPGPQDRLSQDIIESKQKTSKGPQQITAIDLDIETSTTHHPSIDLTEKSLNLDWNNLNTTTELADNSVDEVVSLYAFPYWRGVHDLEVLHGIMRILVPGGEARLHLGEGIVIDQAEIKRLEIELGATITVKQFAGSHSILIITKKTPQSSIHPLEKDNYNLPESNLIVPIVGIGGALLSGTLAPITIGATLALTITNFLVIPTLAKMFPTVGFVQNAAKARDALLGITRLSPAPTPPPAPQNLLDIEQKYLDANGGKYVNMQEQYTDPASHYPAVRAAMYAFAQTSPDNRPLIPGSFLDNRQQVEDKLAFETNRLLNNSKLFSAQKDRADIVLDLTHRMLDKFTQAMPNAPAQEIYDLMRENIYTLAYQDNVAAENLLGTHGILHIVNHDIFTLFNILDQLAGHGQPVQALDYLLGAQALIDHDLGYAMDPVRNEINGNNATMQQNYAADAGHPLLGAQYVRQKYADPKHPYTQIFAGHLDFLHHAILTHSDADIFFDTKEKDQAKKRAQFVLSAIRLSDNTDAFDSKLPDLLTKVPEAAIPLRLLQIVNQIATQGNDNLSRTWAEAETRRLKNQLVDVIRADTTLGVRDRKSLIHAVDHIKPNTYLFTATRMLGQDPVITIESSGKVTISVHQTQIHQQITRLFHIVNQDGQPSFYKQFIKFASDLTGLPKDDVQATLEPALSSKRARKGTVESGHITVKLLPATPITPPSLLTQIEALLTTDKLTALETAIAANQNDFTAIRTSYESAVKNAVTGSDITPIDNNAVIGIRLPHDITDKKGRVILPHNALLGWSPNQLGYLKAAGLTATFRTPADDAWRPITELPTTLDRQQLFQFQLTDITDDKNPTVVGEFISTEAPFVQAKDTYYANSPTLTPIEAPDFTKAVPSAILGPVTIDAYIKGKLRTGISISSTSPYYGALIPEATAALSQLGADNDRVVVMHTGDQTYTFLYTKPTIRDTLPLNSLTALTNTATGEVFTPKLTESDAQFRHRIAQTLALRGGIRLTNPNLVSTYGSLATATTKVRVQASLLMSTLSLKLNDWATTALTYNLHTTLAKTIKFFYSPQGTRAVATLALAAQWAYLITIMLQTHPSDALQAGSIVACLSDPRCTDELLPGHTTKPGDPIEGVDEEFVISQLLRILTRVVSNPAQDIAQSFASIFFGIR